MAKEKETIKNPTEYLVKNKKKVIFLDKGKNSQFVIIYDKNMPLYQHVKS